MSELHSALKNYLVVRRALGHKLVGAEYLLEQFLDFLDQCGASRVTTELALAWATLPTDASAVYQAQRLSAVRRFASWLQSIEPSTEVPPTDILTTRPARAVPYLYTHDEIAAIMTATQSLRSPMRRCTYQALVGLLATTGLRVGEAIRLDRGDVCSGPDLVRVLDTKFQKCREVPLHPSTAQALHRYGQRRDELCPTPRSASFFLSGTGTSLIYGNVYSVFQKLLCHAGLSTRSGRGGPRMHDFRHTFATNTLLDWHRAGADVQAMLPLLSTYLGHVDPTKGSQTVFARHWPGRGVFV
jgi:site-specific recombinase XerD